MRPRGRAVNGWDETGPDPRKLLSFSLITVRPCLDFKKFCVVSVTSNLAAHAWCTKCRRKKTNCTVK